MASEQGYSNQKKKGSAQFKTIHQLGSGRLGAPSSPKGLYELVPAAAIVAVTNILGTNGQIEFLNIQMTAHGASVNDVLRMETGTLLGWEFDVIRVINANNFYILPIADTSPIAAETASIMRWVTQKLAVDGSISASITSAPTQFVRDGLDQQVIQDTVTPSNSRPFPVIALDINGDPVDFAGASPSFRSFANLDFSVSNVTNAAWTQVIATVGVTDIKKIQIFMSSGEPLKLGFGAAASEVQQAIVIPGGNGILEVAIPAGTRLSVQAINAVTVNSGNLMINLLG